MRVKTPISKSNSANRIKNANFAQGAKLLTAWNWSARPQGGCWSRVCEHTGDGICITSDGGAGTASFWQEVPSKRGQFYRIEADVICDLAAEHESGGFFLQAESIVNGKRMESRRIQPILQTTEVHEIRTYYEPAPKARKIRVTLGIDRARGQMFVYQVRLIPILEPEEESHPLAFPPVVQDERHAPPRAKNVLIVAESATARPISRMLGSVLGEENIFTCPPTEFESSLDRADAILLSDPVLPKPLRSLVALKQLAKGRIVIVSLPAFASLTRGIAMVRSIEQENDPIHARFEWSSHATAGLALHDVIPFATRGQAPHSFAQRQFVGSPRFKSFCKRHHFVTLLSSMCSTESKSYHPVALFHQADRGELYVLDIEPAEQPPSIFGEAALARRLLLGCIGHNQSGLGQYSVPPRNEDLFQGFWRELEQRIDHLHIHPAPRGRSHPEWLSIESDGTSPGSQPGGRPLLILRSGLRAGDVESFFAVWTWFKQFLRGPLQPYSCRDAVLREMTPIWIPLSNPTGTWRGWAVPREVNENDDLPKQLRTSPVSLLIDVTSDITDRPRVLIPKRNRLFDLQHGGLPELHPYDGQQPQGKLPFCEPEIHTEPAAFQSPARRRVTRGGGTAVVIELLSLGIAYPAHSIEHTDYSATLIERLVSLRLGFAAPSRKPAMALDA